MRDFPEAYEQTSYSTQVSLSRVKIEIGSTFSEDNFCAHSRKAIQDYSNSQMRFSLRFGQHTKCDLSIKNFDIDEDQLSFAEIVNVDHHESFNP